MGSPDLSVVIPVYNEEDGLPALFARLYPALDALATSYEVILVNDGSRDRSGAMLKDQYLQRPDVTRVVLFNGNYGQHTAIIAGFERVRGARIVTLDADLQNPPEEIGRLLAAMDEGYDYVGGVRRTREDSWWRRTASRAMNGLRERLTHIKMTDQGCMLRAYSRDIVDAVAASREVSTYIPALAYTFAHRPTEIDVAHEERAAGESKYSLYKLIRLNFDLVTGFSLVPLQLFSMFGMAVSAIALLTYLVVIVYRLLFGEWENAFLVFWDRDILAFFLIGVLLFGLGLVGEYVGRIYQQVRERPRYTVRAVLERDERRSARRACRVPPRRRRKSARKSRTRDHVMPARAVVFGYHNVGARCLRVLLAHGLDVPLVVTHEDNPRETIWFERVADVARDYGIATIAPADANAPEIVARIAAARADFLFSFYYRQMLSPALLELPPRGALNMHGSLLPKYRGRAPVNWAIIHGERETGASLHYMAVKPDAGDIVAQTAVPILPDDNALDVFAKVTVAAEMTLDRALPDLLAGTARRLRNDVRAGGYFGGRTAEDGRIDWSKSALTIHNLVRAVAPPYPGATTRVGGVPVRVLRTRVLDDTALPGSGPALDISCDPPRAHCGIGTLAILGLELDGRVLGAQALRQRFDQPMVSLGDD